MKEIENLKLDDIILASLCQGLCRARKSKCWSLSQYGVFKFNDDRAAIGKPWLEGRGGVFRNSKREALFTCS